MVYLSIEIGGEKRVKHNTGREMNPGNVFGLTRGSMQQKWQEG